MEKKVYIDKLFTNRREKLIEMCLRLQEQGKRFLYIMPSSAAIFQVRGRFNELRGGFLGSRVIVFDDLEMDIVKDKIPMGRVIYEPLDRVIISNACRKVKDSLKYYKKIYNKRGFHQEINSFIRTLKRGCIGEERLLEIARGLTDEVLKIKLMDLQLIYSEYNRVLGERDLCDRNDISLRAIDLVKDYRGLKGIDTIIIDGFTDLERINLRLVEEIARLDTVNIIVSSPYENSLTRDFLRGEIEEPFRAMGFETVREEAPELIVDTGFKSLCENLYSGEKDEKFEGSLRLIKYPNIESEAREAARSIKVRLMEGEDPGEIAVYVNNRDDYAEGLTEVFKEYGIPVSLSYELPLGSSELVRKIVKGFEEREEESLTAGEWFGLLEERLEEQKGYMEELVKRTLNGESDFVDILELKALDSLGIFGQDMAKSFEMSGLLDDLLTPEHFMDYLIEGISAIRVQIEEGNNKGVRILSTSLAKGIYLKHAYILGLNEGELPSNLKTSGLFDSREGEELGKLDLGFKSFIWELTREKIRFNLSLASAVKTLTLSYRGAAEDGSFAIPSPFVDEIRFLTGIKEGKNFTMRDRFEGDISSSMSRNELQRGLLKGYFKNLYSGREYKCKDMAGDMAKVVDRGEIEYHREKKGFFNEYEGMLGKDFEKISSILGRFTPSALGSYLDCPFKYMVNNILKIGEPEQEEDEFSSLEIGTFYHAVLFGYYSNLRQFESFEEEIFTRSFNDAFEALRGLEIPQEELERMKRDFNKRLRDFLLLDLERFKTFKKETGGRVLIPYIFEKNMDSGNLFEVEVRCKVDRLDLENEMIDGELKPTGRYVIYDYKKNSMPEVKEILQNGDYQLPIYYLLVEKELKKKLGENMECMALLYMSIEGTEKANKTRKKQQIEMDGIYKTEYKKALSIGKQWDIKGEHFPVVMEYIRGLIEETISQIKSGSFNYKPMCEQHEGYATYECEFKNMCRYSKNKMRRLMEEQQ